MIINLNIILEKRKKKGYTIDDMAKKLNLTNGSMYYKREVGQYKFKAEEVMMVAKILQIPMNQLFLSDEYSKIETKSKQAI
ncbi:helix-turn-helix transcriptional regulator [Siminovitchia sp. FSL W7-1587]|uniref:helix-turn-helix transcriptional regulator n=1 Tax=Siminovitchia sp. FSL W7-1587 TaxID=2954699 RepID=UPI0030CFA9F7